MSAALAFILPLLRNPLFQRIALVAVALFMAFNWGISSCNSKHARKAAKEAAVWAEKIRDADVAGYERGLQAAQNRRQNDKEVDQIVRDAGMQTNAGDSCLSANALERMRPFQ